MSETVQCKVCGCDMPKERLELYDTCIGCTPQFKYRGYDICNGKTGNTVGIIRQDDPEVIRKSQLRGSCIIRRQIPRKNQQE